MDRKERVFYRLVCKDCALYYVEHEDLPKEDGNIKDVYCDRCFSPMSITKVSVLWDDTNALLHT